MVHIRLAEVIRIRLFGPESGIEWKGRPAPAVALTAGCTSMQLSGDGIAVTSEEITSAIDRAPTRNV